MNELRDDPTQAAPNFTAAERWSTDADGVCVSGDLRLAAADDDPTRWLVADARTSSPVCGGSVPNPGYTEYGLLAVLDWNLAEFGVGVLGLDEWCAAAEDRAAVAYVELEDREREDRERPALPGRLARDLTNESPAEIDWLVPGLVAPGWTVKVAAREKVGKGTLAQYVIGSLERGEETCFGPTSRPATAVILTEEPPESMVEKLRLFGVEQARVVYNWELASKTWEEKVGALVEIAVTEGRALVFVDNISRAAGIEDEAGTELARAIEYLQDRCRADRLAAWIDHHHRKGSGSDENMSRGSTSIAGAADINVDMFRRGKGRVRRLKSLGRLRATTWEKLVELSEDGTAYAVVADDLEVAPDEDADHLADRLIVAQRGELTVSEFEGIAGVSKSSARRRLEALVAAGEATVAKPGEDGNEGKASVYRPVPVAATCSATCS